jgi:hypothetical protein
MKGNAFVAAIFSRFLMPNVAQGAGNAGESFFEPCLHGSFSNTAAKLLSGMHEKMG